MYTEHFKNAPAGNDINASRTFYLDILSTVNANFQKAFEAGENCDVLVRNRATFIDQLLISIWGCCVQQHVENAKSIALVAVGGYGRGELHPYSDIDILILLNEQHQDLNNEIIEKFITLLWDLKLDIGQSVRTVSQCAAESEKDVTVLTNLIESRLLCGPYDLFSDMRTAIHPKKIWPSIDFFKAKLAEQEKRHEKFHDTAYNLEPNIKENPGGLRDLQMIAWVTKRHFGSKDLEDLVHQHFLTRPEYEQLMASQSFLWKIRMALHYTAKRREDRLLFDFQKPLAELFGYKDTDNKLGVELLMRDYYTNVMELNRLNEMLLQLFDEVIIHGEIDNNIVDINERFQSINGYLGNKDEQLFTKQPETMFEVFLLQQQHEELKGVRAETIRQLRDHRHLIDDDFRNSDAAKSLFMKIIRQSNGLTHQLRRMNRYGILAAYIPAFDNIVGQMQYDLFHYYTVDEHTLFVLRNVRRMMVDEFKDELPHCNAVIKTVKKPEILYLGALFHDIGKGRGGDHSELGAKDAMDFCLSHGMSEQDTHHVVWLVKSHLFMSRTSQREDINDQDVVHTFAERVGTVERLNYIYLLTTADMRGTGPDVWNSWKGNLLRGLYENTKRALRLGSNSVESKSEQIRSTQQYALKLLVSLDLDESRITMLWKNLSDEYFLRYTPDEICWHTENLLEHDDFIKPMVLINKDVDTNVISIFMYTPIHKGLFINSVSALLSLGLDILDARIVSSNDHYSLNSFTVEESGAETWFTDDRKNEMIQTLQEAALKPDVIPININVQLPRQHKHFDTPTRINIANDADNDRTCMELVTTDRPGLLRAVGKAISKSNINILTAKVSTFGNRAEDLFYVNNYDGSLLDEHQRTELRENLDHYVQQLD